MRNSTIRRTSPFFAVAVVIALLAGACGSDAGDTPDAVPGEQDTEQEAGEEPSAGDEAAAPSSEGDEEGNLHDLLPEAVKSSGVITVATGASYPPDQYIDEDGETIVGWSVDILREIGERLAVEMDISNLDFPGILPAIEANRFDVGSSSYAVTDERLEAVDFVTYYENGQFIAVAEGNPQDIDPADVCGASMAVTQGSLSEITSEALTETCVADGKDPLEVQAFSNASDVYLSISSGRAEITVVNGSTLGNLPDGIEAIGESFSPSTVGFILAKDDNQLRDAMHQALEAMIEDGTYVAILEEWGIENGALSKSEIVS